ncbi:hypothetical protein GGX14DRAFT_444210 [Mycena pura]|uniref:Uncharacterized protein n=1 Tax=Mycena pura TaxID=153505 RepID=A0AAD6VM99_9AGAR|nr:hypothetical protein GGX14DRAFT_444210 [Mycena pura]
MRGNMRALSTVRKQRNPGRRDGYRWNAYYFICPADVDGFVRHARDPTDAMAPIDVDWDIQNDVDVAPFESRHEVAILDIARYHDTKLKGVAKEFEVVRAPRRVIALDEDAFLSRPEDGPQVVGDDPESDWEAIEDIEEFELVGDESASDAYEADFLFARHLQNEEDAQYAAALMRGVSDDMRYPCAANG